MMGALILTAALCSGVGEPPPPVEEDPSFLAVPTVEDLKARVVPRLPTPLGWAGLAGMGLSGVVAFVGLGLVGIAVAQVMGGWAAQEAYDAADTDNSVESARTRRGHLEASRNAFNLSRILGTAGALTLGAAVLASLAAGLVVIVDETFFVPALRARHPVWSVAGPVAGEREPREGWPPSFLPSIPGFTTPPQERPEPAPQEPEAPRD